MEESKRNLAVGAFVLAGLVALGTLVVLFGEAPRMFGRKRYEISAGFRKISGVRPGADIEMGGVRVGIVDRFVFQDQDRPGEGVWMVADIEHEYNIPRDAYVEVKEAPMGLGRPQITIAVPSTAGPEVLVKDGTATLRGEVISAFDAIFPPDIVDTLKTATGHIGGLAEVLKKDLHELLMRRTVRQVDSPPPGVEPEPANLYTAIERFDAAMKHFNDVLGDPSTKSNLKAAVENFTQVSTEAKTVMAELKSFAQHARTIASEATTLPAKINQSLDDANEQLRSVGTRIVGLADQISTLLDHLNEAGRQLADGDGTAGKLLRDPHLYQELTLTCRRLGKTIDDLQALVKQWREEGIRVKSLSLK